MTLRPRQASRRARLVDLTRRDRANRCVTCLRPLPALGALTDWAFPERKYCSMDCLEIAVERAAGDGA